MNSASFLCPHSELVSHVVSMLPNGRLGFKALTSQPAKKSYKRDYAETEALRVFLVNDLVVCIDHVILPIACSISSPIGGCVILGGVTLV